MTEIVLAYEPWTRLAAFAGVFAVMALWELRWPKRPLSLGRGWRWPGNLGVVVLDSLIVRILFPTAAVGVVYRQASLDIALEKSLLLLEMLRPQEQALGPDNLVEHRHASGASAGCLSLKWRA